MFQAALALLGVSSTALVGNDTGAWTCYLAMDEVRGDVRLWVRFPRRIALGDGAGDARARDGVSGRACARPA